MLATRRVLVVHVLEPGAGSPPSVPRPPSTCRPPSVPTRCWRKRPAKSPSKAPKGRGNSACTAKRCRHRHGHGSRDPGRIGAEIRLTRVVSGPRPPALREVLLGSTTQELIKTAPCPVVVAGTHADLDEMKAMNHARVNFIAIDPEWPGEVVQFINSEALSASAAASRGAAAARADFVAASNSVTTAPEEYRLDFRSGSRSV